MPFYFTRFIIGIYYFQCFDHILRCCHVLLRKDLRHVLFQIVQIIFLSVLPQLYHRIHANVGFMDAFMVE